MERYNEYVKTEILQLLRMFHSLPAASIIKFYRGLGRTNVTKALLVDLGKTNSLYYDRKENVCYLYYGMQKDMNKICCFATMLQIMEQLNGKIEDKISKARYPFDYIFESNSNLYQLIDYSENGKYKLRFRRNMDETLLGDTIPVIMTLNQSLDSLIDFDNEMKNTIIPKQDYILARVHVNLNEEENPISVYLYNKKGETL